MVNISTLGILTLKKKLQVSGRRQLKSTGLLNDTGHRWNT
jgi:hypothetical protein